MAKCLTPFQDINSSSFLQKKAIKNGNGVILNRASRISTAEYRDVDEERFNLFIESE
jgi:hypothetical protein